MLSTREVGEVSPDDAMFSILILNYRGCSVFQLCQNAQSWGLLRHRSNFGTRNNR
jgi:hypothetical protein